MMTVANNVATRLCCWNTGSTVSSVASVTAAPIPLDQTIEATLGVDVAVLDAVAFVCYCGIKSCEVVKILVILFVVHRYSIYLFNMKNVENILMTDTSCTIYMHIQFM